MLASKENAADLAALCDLIEGSSVAPVLDRTYSLRDTAEAIERIRSGAAIGKVIISI